METRQVYVGSEGGSSLDKRIIVRIFVSVTLLNMIGQSKEPELHTHQKSFTIPAKQVICIQLGFCRKAEEMMKDSLKL